MTRITPTSSRQCAAPPSPPDDSAGHRNRLRERYRKNGIDSLHPHEILELLLTYSIPRKDTKKLSRALLARFKTVGGVINAPVENLATVDGIGSGSATLFMLVRDMLAWCLKERYEQGNVLSHRNDVESYLRMYFGYRGDEFVAALFLDVANRVIQTEIIAEGTVNQCTLYPRTVFEKALRYRASAIILAHNHPGGTPTPSESDWSVTERLFSAGKMFDIPLLDHIIICPDTVVSLRDLHRWPATKG
jgi:DNA repair protein RadC